MGDRKQPTPVPTNQVRPDPPPAPPRKRADGEPTRDQIAQDYAKALAVIRVLQASNEELSTNHAELLAALKMMLAAYESVLPGIRYIAVQNYKLVNDAPVAAERAIAKAEGR